MKLLNFIASPENPAIPDQTCSCCVRSNVTVKQFNHDYGLESKSFVYLCTKCQKLARSISISSFSINAGHWKFLVQEAKKA